MGVAKWGYALVGDEIQCGVNEIKVSLNLKGEMYEQSRTQSRCLGCIDEQYFGFSGCSDLLGGQLLSLCDFSLSHSKMAS